MFSTFAPTLEKLAWQCGADPAKLAATVQRRNAELKATSPDASTTDDVFTIERGPFYAMGPVSCFVRGTEGGMSVNTKLQILRADGTPIEGLFGAGLFGQGGTVLEGHGQHLSWAFTSGRLAGRHAAYEANTPAITISS
jgi:succinate dehydrogenase/fumarate reductase flavoprotein subunit